MTKPAKLLNRAAKLARKAAKKLKDGQNNASGQFVRLAQLPRNSRLARARMRGWNDVVKGRGYRESYDRWKKAAQLAYERGRQEAAVAKVAAFAQGRALDEWQRDELIQGPMYRAVGAIRGNQIIDEMRKQVRSVS